MIITDTGRIFLDSSVVILNEVKKLSGQIARQTTGDNGVISLSTECYTCYHWLPSIIRDYQKEFPNVEIQLHTGNARQPVDLLLASKIDVAIMYDRKSEKNIAYSDLFTDELVAIVPAGHPYAKKSSLAAKDFASVNHITHSNRFDQSLFYLKFLKPANVMPKKVTYIQLTEAAIEMVKEGLGVTVLPKWLAKPYLENGKAKAVRLNKNGLKRNWYLATLKNGERPKYLQRFFDFLRIGIPT